MNDFDLLLSDVIRQAKEIGIPVGANIRPHVIVNTRAKKRYGCCIKRGFGFTIELSSMLADVDERLCRQTIAHEVLHTCFGCYNHQSRWKSYAARMRAAYGYDIKRTETPFNLGIDEKTAKKAVRYIITCGKCGAVIERTRASRLVKQPQSYRCRCGGKLTVSLNK